MLRWLGPAADTLSEDVDHHEEPLDTADAAVLTDASGGTACEDAPLTTTSSSSSPRPVADRHVHPQYNMSVHWLYRDAESTS